MMTKVFIGGSRKISTLNADVRSRLDRIMEKRFPILVGDANGADKAVQSYLRSKDYSLVEVFCTGNECRNNHGEWPIREILSDAKHRSFEFFSSKDRAMADEASVGLMIWDGKSKGTLMNVLRLLNAGKKVAVYVSASKDFVDLKSIDDWNKFNSSYVDASPKRKERRAKPENRADGGNFHPALF
jgi:adenine-specific DNA-methyltransferase